LHISLSKYLSTLNKVFVVVVLLLASGAFAQHLEPHTELILRPLWSGIYLITFCLVAVRWKQFTLVVGRRGKLLLILVGIAVVSVLWSAAPAATLLDSVSLVGTTLFGCYLAIRFNLGEQLRMLAWALSIAALLSLLFGVALPGYGISSDVLTPEDWQGIYGHKNHLGTYMTLGAVVLLLLIVSERRYRLLRLAILSLSLVLLVLSDSKTALVILLFLLLLLPLYRALREHHTLAVPFVTVGLLGGSMVVLLLLSNSEAVLGAFGRDLSLTGRTQLWAALSDMIYERPWLGYGYGGFWLGWEGESAHVWLATDQRFGEISAFGHAHNGFLEVMVELGFLGVSVFVLHFLLSLARGATWIRLTDTVEGFWPAIFLAFMLLYNLTETAILEGRNLLWIVYVAVALSMFLRNGSAIKKHYKRNYQKETKFTGVRPQERV
jgi:exopolysaccharide production protein ExoQ